MKLAVIPARGGSKCTPRNKIKSFCDNPMIKWLMKVTLLRRCFVQVVAFTAKDGTAMANDVKLTLRQRKGVPS